MLWERGAISPPRDPHEPNLGLVIFIAAFGELAEVCKRLYNNDHAGCG